MADSENRDSHPKSKPRRIAIRLTRNLVLYYRKTASGSHNGEHHRKSYAEKIGERTKDEAWKKPIETIGVIVVFVYTLFAGYQGCKMRDSVNQQVLINRPVALANGIASLEYKDSVPSKSRITIRNFGKTTALGVTPVGHIEVGDADKPAPKDPRCDPNFHAPTFYV